MNKMKKQGKRKCFFMPQNKILRKGQASLEFLMTYGWAFMVIFGVIAVLSYTGIFDFNQFVVERCDFMSGIYCVDGIANTTGVTLQIRNGLPIEIGDTVLYVENCGKAEPSGTDINLSSGSERLYTADCTFSMGQVVKSTIYFNYTNPDSLLVHTKIGKIIYKVSQ